MATPSGRVTPRVGQPADARTCPEQPAAACNVATRPKKRATKPTGGTKVAISLSRRLQVGDVHKISTPATQPSPLATGPKMISHGAHASQRRLPGGGAPALLTVASFLSTARVRAAARICRRARDRHPGPSCDRYG